MRSRRRAEDPFAALARRGLLSVARGNPNSATADFDKVYELAKETKPVLGAGAADDLVAAASHAKAGDHKDEVEALGRVLKAEPGVGYVHWRRGKAYRALSKLDAAVAELTKAIDLGFTRAEVLADRAWVYNDRGGNGDYKRALADANRVIQIDPKQLAGHKEKAYAHLKLKEPDKAIAAANAALKLDPNDSGTFQYRAQAWEAKKEWAKAVEDYTRVIGITPNVAKHYNGRAKAKINLGKYADAAADLTKAIELTPRDAALWNDRGFARIQLGLFSEATRDLERAIELDAKHAAPYKHLGLAALKQKNYGIALQRLTRAIELNPRDTKAFRLRAEGYLAIGEAAKAESDKKKAADLDKIKLGRPIPPNPLTDDHRDARCEQAN